MSPTPVILSPALPSELLTYILNHHVYPTTLIICSTRSDFLQSLAEDVETQSEPGPQPGGTSEQGSSGQDQAPLPEPHNNKHSLFASPLSQLAISRHIRTVYLATVTHLRAYLAVFSLSDSKILSPPPSFSAMGRKPPHLIVYGAIELHRDTSEWSAQGLGNTAAALVETGHRLGWRVSVIEPRSGCEIRGEEGVQRGGGEVGEFEVLLRERIPVLSGGIRRMGLDSEEGSWSGRTVEVGKAMGRWFTFQRGEWGDEQSESQG
ncbi:hypothetical protein BJ170DRAFT_613912 [Xylariales sp. AK1849]|nr:hypothetical protein BJ170DRAFT_613912 [Xylariales sp. AK1849]